MPDSNETPRKLLARKLQDAMRRDVAGQRELLKARAKGETDAVCWDERDKAEHWRRQHRQCLAETEAFISAVTAANQSVRRQIARSREMLAFR